MDVAKIGESEVCVETILIRESELTAKVVAPVGKNVDMTELIADATIDGVGGNDEARQLVEQGLLLK